MAVGSRVPSKVLNKTAGLDTGGPAAMRIRITADVSALSVDAVVLALEARDFVLHLQLAALEFNQLEIISCVMLLRLGNFVVEGLVLLFKCSKIRLDGHMGYLLVSDFRLTHKVCHVACHKSAIIYCAAQQFRRFRHRVTATRFRIPRQAW